MTLQNFTLGTFSQGAAGGGAAFESIATATGNGSVTSLDFNSISSSYQHLQLRCIFQRNGGTQLDVGLRFNSDTGSNYSMHSLSGDGSAVAAAGSANTSYINAGIGSGTSTSNIYGVAIMDILDYASTTKNKTVRTFTGVDKNNTEGSVKLYSGVWRNTNAITSITIYTFGDAINTNSTFALYGIKGA